MSGQAVRHAICSLHQRTDHEPATAALLTVIRFVQVSAKFATCTVVSVNGTHFEGKMCTFTLESTHFIFNTCPIYTHDGASAKFSTSLHETDYSARAKLAKTMIWDNPLAFGFSVETPGGSAQRDYKG